MISFTLETQRPFWWTSVTSCFVLVAALCCCNALPYQKTPNMVDRLRSTSESSTMPDTAEQLETTVLDLGSLLDAENGGIVTLVAGDTRLAVHRAVLVAGSPILAAMFRPDTPNASGSEVNIPGVEGPVLRQLVAFLYTGRASQLSGMASQLLAAAEKYGVSALKDSIAPQLAEKLSVENVVATAVLAQKYGSHSLRQAAVAFIKDHPEVLATNGWAEAVLNQPAEVMQIICVLTQPPAETNATTIEDGMPITTVSATSATISAAPTTADGTATLAAAATTTFTATARPHSDHGHTAAAALLPSAGCNIPLPNTTALSHFRSLSAEEKGRRLTQAAKEGSVPEVGALLYAGADARARDRSQITALHWAAFWGHVEAARCLLQAGAEVDARDRWRITPLIRAAWSGHTDVVLLLLAANADPRARNDDGLTPLHVAAWYGTPEMLAMLLQAGADRGATTNRGETALDIARRRKQQRLIQMLQ